MARKTFNVPEGTAAQSLKRFSEQAGLEVIFSTRVANGVRTRAVKGEMTPRAALESMLVNTGLVVVQDERTGAFSVRPETVEEKKDQGAAQKTPSDRPRVVAQPTPAENASGSDPLVLSPFTVEASSDTGYAASSTLAGTRLKTDLKDVASQISVMTKDLLDDLGVTTPEQAFAYSLNVESYAENHQVEQPEAGVMRLRTGNRIRGLTAPTNSQNFFESIIELDNYNSERLTIASGPNAILFGLGSPAGIVDTTLKAANIRRNHGSVSARIDQHGAWRAELDSNVAIRRDKVALRLAALKTGGEQFLEPAYDHQKRIYGALTFQPVKRLTFRIQAEDMNREANRAVFQLPHDHISAFAVNGSQIWTRGTPLPTYLENNGSNLSVFVNGADASGGSLAPASWNGAANVRWLGSATLAARPDDLLYNPAFRVEDNYRYSLKDDTYYPVKKYNLYGNTRLNRVNGQSVFAFAEFQLLDDFFGEVAYGEQSRTETEGGYFRGVDLILYADPNALLPASYGVDRPNPNAGRTYVEGENWGWIFADKVRELRATLSYEKNLTKINRWLGRHRLAGMLSTRESTVVQQSFFRYIVGNTDGSVPTLVNHPAAQPGRPNYATAGNNNRRVRVRTYLDLAGDGPKYGQRSPLLPPHDPWFVPDPGNPAKTMYIPLFDEEFGAFRAAYNNRLQPDSGMLAYNGFFWQDRVVLTYGRRIDRVRRSNLVGSSVRQFNGLFPHYKTLHWDRYGPAEEMTNFVKGAVLHIPERLSWIDASIFYNTATNNSLGNVQLGIDGNRNPGQVGQGEDYGVRLALWGDRIVLRLNRFENTAARAEVPVALNFLRDRMSTLENRFYDIDPNYKAGTFDPVSRGMSDYALLYDQQSKGTEYELTANPIKGLNFRLVAGQQKSRVANVGPDWIAYSRDRVSEWQNIEWWDLSDRANPLPVVAWDRSTGAFTVGSRGQQPLKGWDNVGHSAAPAASTMTTFRQAHDALVLREVYFLENQVGQRNTQTREWRVNATAAYSFPAGWLKGLRTGLSGRYRDRSVIGYRSNYVSVGGRNVLVAELDQPIYTPSQWFFDAFVAYRQRIGRYTYRVQLNVQNVLDVDDIYGIQADSYGVPTRYAKFEGRNAFLSTTFEF